MWEAKFLHYLCSEWNYAGVSAVLAEDSRRLLRIVSVYELSQAEVADSGMPVTPSPPLFTEAELDAMGVPSLATSSG